MGRSKECFNTHEQGYDTQRSDRMCFRRRGSKKCKPNCLPQVVGFVQLDSVDPGKSVQKWYPPQRDSNSCTELEKFAGYSLPPGKQSIYIRQRTFTATPCHFVYQGRYRSARKSQPGKETFLRPPTFDRIVEGSSIIQRMGFTA